MESPKGWSDPLNENIQAAIIQLIQLVLPKGHVKRVTFINNKNKLVIMEIVMEKIGNINHYDLLARDEHHHQKPYQY